MGGVLAGAGAGLVLWVAAGVVLCENAVHVAKRATPDISFAHVDRREVQITARDGAALRGWFFVAENRNGTR